VPRRRGTKRGSGGSSRRQSTKKKSWKLDMDTVVPEVGKQVIEQLGLDYIGIGVDDIRDILEDIIQGIAESRSTKPSIESLVKNIVRNKLLFYKSIATKLIFKDNLTLEQLEFIVSYAPEAAGRAAPKLYHVAREIGADHIVEALRALWARYGKPTPFTCPRCGFRALGPDLRCMVCGAEVTEEEIKKLIDFNKIITIIAKNNPVAAFEIVSAGFALYDGETVRPPSARPLLSGRPVIELYLTRSEKEEIERIARNRIEG